MTQQLQYAALPQLGGGDVELRRIEFLKLLRQAPEVTDIAQLDGAGRELIAVSRLGMDALGSGKDRSAEPAFQQARRGEPWFGPVYFRKETEPYMTVAVRSGGEGSPVTVAELNLKFIWDVVSRIKIGDKGKAYVVGRDGYLVADPDIGLVLRKTSMAGLEHVRAAADKAGGDEPAMRSHDLKGTSVLASVAAIEPLGWKVFVEQPVSEVFARLNASILWMAGLLLAGLAVSALAASALARSMVRPIATLDEGARRIGAGELDQQIVVRTNDELEGLADQFNHMSAQLRESYAGLERKVDARTAELSESLEYQTAISEVLRVISQSQTDVNPVFEAIMDSANRLFGSPMSAVYRFDGKWLHLVAYRNWTDAAIDDARRLYPGPPQPEMLTGRVVTTGQSQTIVDTFADPRYDQKTAQAGQWRRMHGTPMVKDGAVLGVLVLAWPDSGRNAAASGRSAQDLCRPGGDRHRERAPDQRDARGARAADGHGRNPARHQRLDHRHATGVRRHRAQRPAPAGRQDRGAGAAARRPVHDPCSGQRRHRHGHGRRDEALAAGPRQRRWRLHPRIARHRGARHGSKAPGSSRACPTWRLRWATARRCSCRLLREGKAMGCLTILRADTGDFQTKEIALMQTFADQAVIAIENVRLFNETNDALEQQTAIAEVLRVISRSTIDIEPVFAAIMDSAMRLFGAPIAAVFRYDGTPGAPGGHARLVGGIAGGRYAGCTRRRRIRT